LFGDKYSKKVRVVGYGDCSKELCGGTHLKSTSFIGSFVLFSDTSIASGIRRIEAVTRLVAHEYNQQQKSMLHLCAQKLNCKVENIEEEINLLQHNNLKLKKDVDSYILDSQKNKIIEWQKKYLSAKSGAMVFVEIVENSNMSDLRELTDQIANMQSSCAFVLLGNSGEKVSFICVVSKDLHSKLDARKVLDYMKADYKCSGGGRPDFVQGAIVDVEINKLKTTLLNWLNSNL
jgi:alanyl-tRNA synthetase